MRIVTKRMIMMVDPPDNDPVSHGGAFRFHDGQAAARLPFDEEGIPQGMQFREAEPNHVHLLTVTVEKK